MKKLASAIAVMALIGTPAFAADMAVKAPPPAPAPVSNWTGWYAGINFGAGLGTSNNPTTTTTITPLSDSFAPFFTPPPPSGSLALASSVNAAVNQNGPIGGGQFGYNWQLAPRFVVGFEADIQGSAISGSRGDSNAGTSTESFPGSSSSTVTCSASGTTVSVSCMGNGTRLFFATHVDTNVAELLTAAWTNPGFSTSAFNSSMTADVNWLGTVRARLGYLITPNLLLYATGGLAYGGVSASDSLTTNLNYTADSFALAYAQALGPLAQASGTATAGPTTSAQVSASTASITLSMPNTTPTNVTISSSGGTTSNSVGVQGPPTSTGFFTASSPGESINALAQASKPLSVAVQSQSLARVSDTKFGGTVGGGIEWMMAPNWSVKAEALYYDLGSVTVTTTSASSINPLTAAVPATLFGTSTANITGAINKLAGSAGFGPTTVSNTATTHVNFQGVIIRIGLNYHFNLL